jgi:ribosomal protein L20A (L18A)
MPTYRVKGTIRRTEYYDVDEEVEAENEDKAIDAVCEDLDSHRCWSSDDDVYDVKVEKIRDDEPGDEVLTMPLLREKDDLAALAAWNAGKPIKGTR